MVPRTEADLQDWINNRIDENLQLDFKAADALQNTDRNKTEIAKDVSALANVTGGAIVYGNVWSATRPGTAPRRAHRCARGAWR